MLSRQVNNYLCFHFIRITMLENRPRPTNLIDKVEAGIPVRMLRVRNDGGMH